MKSVDLWDDLVPDSEKDIYAKGGFGQRGGAGTAPALLVIDTQYRTAGETPKPIQEAIKEYPTSCGEHAWRAVPHIQTLLTAFRKHGRPVLYAIIERESAFDAGKWSSKISGMDAAINKPGNRGTQILEELAPQEGELVFSKRYASAFFGTPLVTHLNNYRADTLVVTGTTTSGCVRASTVDAFSYGFSVLVPHDAVYDRSQVSHKINLFDMQAKYADVVASSDVVEYVGRLAGRKVLAPNSWTLS